MPNFLPHLRERLVGTVLLLERERAKIISNALSDRVGLAKFPIATQDTTEAAPSLFSAKRRRNPLTGAFIELCPRDGNIGVIRIVGELVNRGEWLDAPSGLVSYEGITAQINEAVNDPQIAAIVLDLDCPGGEAGGFTACCASIRQARAKKPVIATINSMACSGGYALACSASEIVAIEGATLGSIGVVMVHIDQSAAMENAGLKPTIIQSGGAKTLVSGLKPLNDAGHVDLQSKIDTIHEQFLDVVAQGRGAKLTHEAARATDAQVFFAKEAVALGLADRIGTREEVIADLKSRFHDRRKKRMDDDENDTSIALEARLQSAKSEGLSAGIAQERARFAAVLNSELGQQNPKMAAFLLSKTDMNSDDLIESLQTMPQAVAPGQSASIASRAEGHETIGPITDQLDTKNTAALGDAVSMLNKRKY